VKPQTSGLSDRTRAEMYRGGASVGTPETEVNAKITGTAARAKADYWVKKFQERYPHGAINVTAERVPDTDVWKIATIVYQSGQPMITLGFEPVESYPSGKLLAQLALVVG